MNLLDRLVPPKILTLPNGRQIRQPRSMLIPTIIILLAFAVLSIEVTGFDLAVLARRGKQFFVILGDMIPPDLTYMNNVWQPLFDTIKMSVLGSAIGAVAAIPFAVIAASDIVKSRIVISTTRVFFSLVRTLPTLVTALIATYIFGLGTLAGTTSIAIFTFAYVGKLLYEQIETVDMGAFEAIESLGSTRTQAFLYAIVPQVMPGYIANCLFCFEGNVRYASILGYVGAGGLGLILNEKIGWREYDKVGMILLMLFVTVVIIEFVSHAIRKKLT